MTSRRLRAPRGGRSLIRKSSPTAGAARPRPHPSVTGDWFFRSLLRSWTSGRSGPTARHRFAVPAAPARSLPCHRTSRFGERAEAAVHRKVCQTFLLHHVAARGYLGHDDP